MTNGAGPAPPILVTGSHRSGSTWVGTMLASAPDVGYVHEPFSRLHRPGVCSARFETWFPYMCPENEAPYVAPIRDMLSFRYGTGAELRALRTPRDAARMVRDRAHFAAWRWRGVRALLKDPIAVFSAEWLADRFDVQVLALIRHPAAFASSLKRLEWRHPFGDFLAQPLLMRDVLGPFEDEIRDYADREHSPLDQAILLWKLVHHRIAEYRSRRPDFLFARHEDLSNDPVTEFAAVFERLALPFDARSRAAITRSTDPSNPIEAEPGELRRDSRSGVWNWATRLTPEEIRVVRKRTEPIARLFYDDHDWEPILARGSSR
jgi:Sulfotransferase family